MIEFSSGTITLYYYLKGWFNFEQIRSIALLMAVLLLAGLFAGCNANTDNETPTPPSQSGSPSNSPATETPGNELPYPKLSAEPVEVTVWQTFSADYSVNE